MFTSGTGYSLLYGSTSVVATYMLYTYRYNCFYQLCVWYACCKRKCRRKQNVSTKETNAFRTLDFTDGSILEEVSDVNPISSVTLFPHIKEIRTSIKNHDLIEKIHHAVRDYRVIYDAKQKSPSKTLATKKMCLYTELAKEFATLPPSITVVLDKQLIDLLNIKLPVRSLTGNATYVLSDSSEETIVLHR